MWRMCGEGGWPGDQGVEAEGMGRDAVTLQEAS